MLANIHSFKIVNMISEISVRQKEIIKASLVLISENGIQGLTIKNLSKKIGIAESSIYRHYENKTQILLAILESIAELTEPEKEYKCVNTLSLIEQKLKYRFQTFVAFPALVSVVFSEDLFQNESLLVEKTKTIMQKRIEDMTALVKYGQNQGEISQIIDAEYFAIMILGTIRLFVKKWKMYDYSFDLIKKGDELIDSLKTVLKPSCL